MKQCININVEINVRFSTKILLNIYVIFTKWVLFYQTKQQTAYLAIDKSGLCKLLARFYLNQINSLLLLVPPKKRFI